MKKLTILSAKIGKWFAHSPKLFGNVVGMYDSEQTVVNNIIGKQHWHTDYV